MEERAKREEKASMNAQDRMVGLEEKNRQLKEIIKNKNIQVNSYNNDDLD